ncbi:hypothetical protein CRM22_010274 [Opisthorchis felineus]|uniref:Uncharacterized protein n=1 Tax=Opisthorchis felineus TaxID=147828 RepID=A0A4S2L5L0_OPIFE|nr:hypothetical protein CRM22_010274 [Opisthorchis felineus]
MGENKGIQYFSFKINKKILQPDGGLSDEAVLWLVTEQLNKKQEHCNIVLVNKNSFLDVTTIGVQSTQIMESEKQEPSCDKFKEILNSDSVEIVKCGEIGAKPTTSLYETLKVYDVRYNKKLSFTEYIGVQERLNGGRPLC